MAARVGGIYIDISADATKYITSLRRAAEATSAFGRASNRSLQQLNTAAEGSVAPINKLSSAIGGISLVPFTRQIAALTGLALGTRELIQYADTWARVQNRLRLVTQDTADLADTTQTVFQIAQQNRQAFDVVAESYTRLAQAAESAGIQGDRLANIMDLITKTVRISGTSSQETRNALIQLAQGFASGQLRGDEFRSVAEQLPALLREMAKAMGLTIGQLRALAFEGGLTTDVLVDAIEKQGDSIRRQAELIIPTLSESFIVAGNSLTRFIGTLTESTGLISGATSIIITTANAFDFLSATIQAVSDSLPSLAPYSTVIDTLNKLAEALAAFQTVRETAEFTAGQRIIRDLPVQLPEDAVEQLAAQDRLIALLESQLDRLSAVSRQRTGVSIFDVEGRAELPEDIVDNYTRITNRLVEAQRERGRVARAAERDALEKAYGGELGRFLQKQFDVAYKDIKIPLLTDLTGGRFAIPSIEIKPPSDEALRAFIAILDRDIADYATELTEIIERSQRQGLEFSADITLEQLTAAGAGEIGDAFDPAIVAIATLNEKIAAARRQIEELSQLRIALRINIDLDASDVSEVTDTLTRMQSAIQSAQIIRPPVPGNFLQQVRNAFGEVIGYTNKFDASATRAGNRLKEWREEAKAVADNMEAAADAAEKAHEAFTSALERLGDAGLKLQLKPTLIDITPDERQALIERYKGMDVPIATKAAVPTPSPVAPRTSAIIEKAGKETFEATVGISGVTEAIKREEDLSDALELVTDRLADMADAGQQSSQTFRNLIMVQADLQTELGNARSALVDYNREFERRQRFATLIALREELGATTAEARSAADSINTALTNAISGTPIRGETLARDIVAGLAKVELGNTLTEPIQTAFDGLAKPILDAIFNPIQIALNGIVGAVVEVGNPLIEAIVAPFEAAFTFVAELASKAFQYIAELASDAFSAISGVITDSIVEGFAASTVGKEATAGLSDLVAGLFSTVGAGAPAPATGPPTPLFPGVPGIGSPLDIVATGATLLGGAGTDDLLGGAGADTLGGEASGGFLAEMSGIFTNLTSSLGSLFGTAGGGGFLGSLSSIFGVGTGSGFLGSLSSIFSGLTTSLTGLFGGGAGAAGAAGGLGALGPIGLGIGGAAGIFGILKLLGVFQHGGRAQVGGPSAALMTRGEMAVVMPRGGTRAAAGGNVVPMPRPIVSRALRAPSGRLSRKEIRSLQTIVEPGIVEIGGEPGTDTTLVQLHGAAALPGTEVQVFTRQQWRRQMAGPAMAAAMLAMPMNVEVDHHAPAVVFGHASHVSAVRGGNLDRTPGTPAQRSAIASHSREERVRQLARLSQPSAGMLPELSRPNLTIATIAGPDIHERPEPASPMAVRGHTVGGGAGHLALLARFHQERDGQERAVKEAVAREFAFSPRVTIPLTQRASSFPLTTNEIIGDGVLQTVKAPMMGGDVVRHVPIPMPERLAASPPPPGPISVTQLPGTTQNIALTKQPVQTATQTFSPAISFANAMTLEQGDVLRAVAGDRGLPGIALDRGVHRHTIFAQGQRQRDAAPIEETPITRLSMTNVLPPLHRSTFIEAQKSAAATTFLGDSHSAHRSIHHHAAAATGRDNTAMAPPVAREAPPSISTKLIRELNERTASVATKTIEMTKAALAPASNVMDQTFVNITAEQERENKRRQTAQRQMAAYRSMRSMARAVPSAQMPRFATGGTMEIGSPGRAVFAASPGERVSVLRSSEIARQIEKIHRINSRDFLVPGKVGGTDTTLVDLLVREGDMVTVMTPGQQAKFRVRGFQSGGSLDYGAVAALSDFRDTQANVNVNVNQDLRGSTLPKSFERDIVRVVQAQMARAMPQIIGATTEQLRKSYTTRKRSNLAK